MAQNVSSPDSKPISLSVFAGLVTNVNPTALPAGASPDCSDNSFLPGGVSQRPCVRRVFSTPWGTATTTYGKTYIDPAGVIRNLFLDSAGNIWVENLTTNPGVYTLLAITTPGTYAKSITAFGREYIAISDGLHGQEVPLQYDGTFLDRVSQDGPGASPTVVSLAIPPSQMLSNATPPATLTITGIFPDQQAYAGGYFTTLNIYVTTGGNAVVVGTQVTVSGTASIFDGTYPVIANPGTGGTIAVSAYFPPGTTPYSGTGTLTLPGTGSGSVTMTRVNNVVTVMTATPHQLQPGYQAQITNVNAAPVGGSIVSIVIDNENFNGIATITTTLPHGLVPDSFVGLTGVAASTIGGGIIDTSLVNQILTVETAGPHNLQPGAQVQLLGTADQDATYAVFAVLSPTVFSVPAVSSNATGGAGGDVFLLWPITNSGTPQLFEVVAAPTATSFQIAVNYPDGTWNSGNLTFAWDGTFFVQTIPTPTSFTYQQFGPDAQSTDVGTVTPYGQIAPGPHQAQCFFITRQGYATAPSPPITVQFDGGQYAAVSNIPIGPPNVVARVIAFTGAKGAYFFYIPSVPQVNGQIVGTATQINDNTTTSAVFDFGDPTLYAALGISIQGNNLANQGVIEGALGFGFYGSRLFTYGQRNVVDGGDTGIGFLNMGFDGGYLTSAPTVPTGWTLNPASTGGALGNGHYGQAWTIAVTPGGTFCGLISQNAYQDYLGVPILEANTQYRVRLWVKSNIAVGDIGLSVTISSFDVSFDSVALITNITMAGGWAEADFTLKTPAVIPPDLILSVYGSGASTSGVVLTVDEISIIFSEQPYLTGMYASYVNNPEAFDIVTGVIGPEDDTHQVMDLGVIRSNLYMLTLDPSGRLHETSQGIGEPNTWNVNEVAANCGTVSAFALTRSQADSGTPAGGEEWFTWISSTGIRIFGGEAPDKISQEIQRPQGPIFPGAPQDLGAFNPLAQLTAWSLNDPAQKTMWFGIPSGTATAPNVIYQLSYVGLDSASAIVSNPPIHKALSGKMVATDLGRKWSPWRIPMNGGALMYREAGQVVPVFFSGNGRYPSVAGSAGAYVQHVSGVSTVSVLAATHGQGKTPYVLAIQDGTGQFQDVSVVNMLSGGSPTGNMAVSFGPAFSGTLVIGAGGIYTQSVSGLSTVVISEAIHGQGKTPYVIALDNAGNFIYPGVVNQEIAGPSGNLTVSFAPPFTGLIIVGSGTSFVAPEIAVTSVTIPAATHGQGSTPYVLAIDIHGNMVAPLIVNALSGSTPTGNMTVSFNPPFTGVVVVGGGEVQGHGNVYTLDASLYTDNDYGEMSPYYVSHGIPDIEEEQQNQLSSMKMVAYSASFITGEGLLTISILYNTLANAWPLNGVYPLQGSPPFDLEWAGGQATAQRFFFKWEMSPNPAGTTASPGTDVAFSLTRFTAWVKNNARMRVRGSYP